MNEEFAPLEGKSDSELEKEAPLPPKWRLPDIDRPTPEILFKVQEYFDNSYRVSFTIDNQTFFLSPVASHEEADWYIDCLKIAFKKLII